MSLPALIIPFKTNVGHFLVNFDNLIFQSSFWCISNRFYKDFTERYDLTAQHYTEIIMCYWHWKLNKFVSGIEKITSLQGYKCIEKYHVVYWCDYMISLHLDLSQPINLWVSVIGLRILSQIYSSPSKALYM